MNENKTNKENTGATKHSILPTIGGVFLATKHALITTARWLKKEIVLVIGAIIVIAVTLTVTQATPVSRWVAYPSTNCLTQGTGNTMVENNGIVYVLFGSSTSFRAFDPVTGECSSSALANFPATTSSATKLINIDDDTLLGTSGGRNYFYHIQENFWSFYNRSKADDSAIPSPIAHPNYALALGNAIATYNNELYLLVGNNSSYFQKYSPATNSWTTLSSSPGAFSSGAALIYPGSGNYLYALRGYGYNSFYRYDITGNSWATMTAAPDIVRAGGAMTAISGTDIYAFGGYNTKRFWKYSISGDSWTDLSTTYPLPEHVYGGGAMTSIGSVIYAMPGNMSESFWALDTAAGTPIWAEKADLPDRIFSGGALTTDGTYIYATKGFAFGFFHRYDPTTNTWTSLDPSHTVIGGNSYSEAHGGLSYVPIGPSGGPEIYLSTGVGTLSTCTSSCYESLARYIIANNTWPVYLTPPTPPATLSNGASAAHPGGSDDIYILSGGNTTNFWKLLISRNLYLPFHIGKIDAIREIMTWIPGMSSLSQGTGSSMALANGKLYSLPGNGYPYFLEYDPLANRWNELPPAPQNITTGGALTRYDDNTLFASSGTFFSKYDIPTKTWFYINIGKNSNEEAISQIIGDNTTYHYLLNQNYGSHIVEKNGEFYIITGGGGTGFLQYNPAQNRWTQLQNLPTYPGRGSASVVVDDYIYTLRGDANTNFSRYQFSTYAWSNMAVTPTSVAAGGSVTHPGGDFLYALGGNSTTNFFRYCMQNTGSGCTANTWTNLSSTFPVPHTVYGGGALTALNSTTLYAMAGNGTKNFMRFDITDSPAQGDGTWTDLTGIDPLPDIVGSGGSLTTDGTYLYATQGQITGTFWRYDPAGTAGSRWSVLQTAPVNIGYTTDRTYAYGGITYSPTLGEIYAIPGNGFGGFNQNSGNGPSLLFRYQLPASSADPADDNTWTYFPATAAPPTSFALGGALTSADGGEFIYAFRGGGQTNFWRYNVTGNTWDIIYQSKLDDDTRVSQGNVSQSQDVGNTIAEVDGIFYVINGSGTNFQKYDPSTNTWTPLPNTPASCSSGASITKIDSDNLYVFGGGSTTNFWRFHIPSNSWNNFNIAYRPDGTIISQSGGTQGTSNSIVKANDPYSGNPLFFIVPADSNTFQKYDPSSNTWTTLAPLPITAYYGTSMVNIGTDIYFKFQNYTNFYKYSIPENTWTTLTSSPLTIRAGNNLAYPGSGDFIYILRGYDANVFYAYSISGNSWSTLATAPGTSDAGGSLAFLNSNDLYALGGNNTRNFWKYDVGTNTWDSLVGNQPGFVALVQAGGSLTSDGTYIYASVGNNTKEFWRYDPAAASGSRWYRFNSTTVGSTGDIPASMGSTSNTYQRGNITLCDNCVGGGLKEIWATTGNGITGFPTNDNAALIHRFRIDPVTCDAFSGLNPGTGSSSCTGYNSWIHYPKPAVALGTVSYGGGLTYPGSGDLIYALRGAASTTFWAYNMVTNAWSTLTVAPATVSGGGAITSYMNGANPDIYVLRGLNTNTFWLYRVTDPATGAGSWNPVDPTDKPGTAVQSGGSLTFDGSDNIYASSGTGTNQIYRYNISGDSWSNLSPSPYDDDLSLPSPLYIGSASTTAARGGIAYTANGPSGGPELFAVTGYGNSGTSFASPFSWAGLIFRYPLTTGPNVGTWPISYTPAAQPTGAVNYGGALTSTDSDSVFAFQGGLTNAFWRYDIGSNAWSTLTVAPATIGSGGSLTNNGVDTVYATRGNLTNTFYKYTITDAATGAGSWTTMSNAPVPVSNNSGSAQGGVVYSANLPNSGDETVWMIPGYGRSPTDNTGLAALLFRYDVSTDSWPHFAPAADAPTNANFSAGSDLAMSPDGTTIFALRGTEPSYNYGGTYWSSANSNFWKYTIGTNTWTALTNVLNNTVPLRVYSGGSITGNDTSPDDLFIFTGGDSKDVLKYSITGNSWIAPGNLLFPFTIGQLTTADGGELIYSPSTERLLGTTGKDNVTPFTIYYADLANQATPTLASSWATTDGTFNIEVSATDLNNNPVNVTQDTSITLSLASGTGTLGGNLTGTILNGQNSVTISGVTYDTVESSITLTATDTSVAPTLVPGMVSFPVYGPAPTISTITPNTGSTAGGTSVTIEGTNFIDGAYVTFNGTGAPVVNFISSTELQVITPATNAVSVPLAVDVVVVNPSEQSATAALGYTYNGPTVTSITPDEGGVAGGTVVTITGSNFGPDAYIREITITNPNSTLTDYPVSFTVDTATLIAAGKMRPDCGDIRMLAEEQSRQMNYWIEDLTCNTSSTRIWTKVPGLANGANAIFMTYGNKNLPPASDGDSVFYFFDDFEDSTLDTSKWTVTTGTPSLLDGKLILNYYDTGTAEGVFAGGYPIPANTVWETYANPGATGRYGNAVKGASNSSYAFTADATAGIVSTSWLSSTLYAETLIGNTSMGAYAIGFKPYKLIYRPSGNNQALFYYNNGAATTVFGTDQPDTLYPSILNSSGTYQAQWEYTFIRPYGGLTEPSFSVGAETGGALQVDFNTALVGFPAQDIEFINNTTIRAVAPAGTLGIFDIIVTLPDGRSSTLSSAYTYAAPTITGVTPNVGTTNGGSTITIEGTNFSEGGYHRAVTIMNASGSALTDQTLNFTLDTASLISGGKMQSDCRDIRVKDSDHVTYLNYWVEACNSSLSRVWIQLPSLPLDGKNIYVHYGNANYASGATPENFFPTLASANNVMWLKSDYGIHLTSGAVSSWDDLSGNGNTVTAPAAANYPAYNTVIHNGIPAVSFDGATTDYMFRTGFTGLPTGNASRSVFMVNRYDKAGVAGFTYGNNATLQAFGLVDSSSTTYGYLGVQGYGTDYFTTNRALYHGILLQEAVLNGINLIQYRNGNLILNTASTAFNTAATKIEIGREIDGTPYSDMDLFEVIVFNKALSTEERQEIENYITLKYDLNNTIHTSTYTGPEVGSSGTFSANIADMPIVPFTSFAFGDDNSIYAVTPAHFADTVDITVTTPGASDVTLVDGYTFADPPTITSIDPVTGTNGEILSVDVIGTNITAATELKLSKTGETDIVCSNYSGVTSTTLTCDLDLRYADLGFWNVDIYTPNLTPGANSSLTDGFEITQSPPEITGIEPPGGSTLGGTAVTISGNYFIRKAGNYTTPITINNSGAVQTDFQSRFTLDTASAIASGKMRSDCGDLRMYADSTYDTLIPYYIENGCNTASTVIWTKVPTVAASTTTTVYANYGIPNRISTSNGNDVFLFFDDFEGGSIDAGKWVVGGNVNWMIEAADSFQGTYSSKNGDIAASQSSYIATKDGSGLISIPVGSVGIIDFYWKVSSEGGYDYNYYCKSDDDTTLPSCTRGAGYINRIAGTWAWTREQSTGTTLAAGSHRIKFAYEKDGSGDVGSDTGWIDSIKVRIYSTSVADGVAGTEATEQNGPTVTFDTTDATDVTYLDSSTLIAVAPAHSAGAVDITVTNPDLQTDVSPVQFTYSAPPIISAIDPITGFTSESAKTVTITGTDFQATPTAKLARSGKPDITCTTPRNFIDGAPDSFQCDLDLTGQAFGDWNVVMQNPDQQSSTLTNGFEIFYPSPTLTDIDPEVGPASGGTTITLTGTNFVETDTYIVPYLISYNGTALTDYQVLLQLDTDTLAGSTMRADCADIRAFDSDRSTPLDYYIENFSACGTATPLNVWVEVPSVPDGGKNIYLKYGDATWTTTLSSDTNTFISVIPNVLAEWRMDELSGATVEDSSSGNNDGTAIGTTIVDGKYGKARQFQGNPDYINFGSNAAINPSGTEAEHTMEAWIKLEPTQNDYPTLFNLWEENGVYDKSYELDFPGGNVRYYVRNAANSLERSLTSSSPYLFDNNWHHIVVTNDRDGGLNYLRIYIDGTLRNTSTGSNYGMRTVLPTINLQMGKQTWSGFQGLHGLIDEARVYDRALTQTEITALFNNYGFLEANSSNLLVAQTTATPPSVGAAGAATLEPPQVTFGLTEATSVTFLNSTSLEAVTPAGTGTVDVTVTNVDSQFATLSNAFTYTPPPTITSIVPDTGHNQESLTGVVITGTDFVNAPTVTLYIGETPLSCTNVTFVNSTQITCDLNLNGAFAGLYGLQVRNPDLQTDYLVDAFEVTYPQPTITNINPAVGLVAGGETILITGTYFADGATVDFDGTYSSSVTFIGPTQLEVTTPAHTIGLKDVTVTNPSAMTVTAIDGFEYIDPPIVTGIVPATGSNDQSALAVTISGSNFVAALSAKLTKAGQTDIICGTAYNFIDGSPDDSFQCDFNISDAITGFWNLIVTNGNSQVSEPLANAFEITFAPPTVTSIINNEVASGSTQQVTVGGTNFYSEDPNFITIDIGGTGGVGGTPCTTPVVVNPNSVTCYLPSLTAGTYDVTVTTGAGTDTAENLITYFDAPTVTSVDPNHGLTVGGTEITITGTNFFGTPTVFMTHTPMEETTATNVIVVNSTTITATTPASTVGPVDVRVVTEAGSDTLDDGYTYDAPPVDPDASSLDIYGYRIEPVNTTYYDNDNLSPVHASLIKVTAIETLTGNPIIGRTVIVSANPATDLLIHAASCDNLYSSSPGSTAVTDTYGTACFLFWSTATPSLTSNSSAISATIDGSGPYGPVAVTDTATLEIESLAITSILNYRFRNDDGTELTASPIADTSTPYYNAQNELAFRLRFGLTRNMPLASSFARNDEFAPSANAEIGPRPLPAPSPEGLSSFRAFPAYALNNSTNTLYIATPNRADSKARIYKFNLSDLAQAATFFEFPGTVNFTPVTDDDPDAPIDGATHMITKMFIDEDNDLMYFVITPYFDDIGRTKVYKINLLTETVVDVLSESPYSMKGTLDSEIDLNNGFLYLTSGMSITPNDNLQTIGIQKISLNGPTEPMTMVGELMLENTYGNINASVIDLTNQFLYVTTGSPQKIIKVDLDVSTSLPPVKVDEIALAPVTADSPIEQVGVQAAVIDPVNGYAYFASSSDFTHPDYDNNQLAFLTKVDIDPARDFEVVSRLSLIPPSPASDYNYNAEYVYMSPIFTNYRLYPFASIDQVNGYAFFPMARLNPVRDLVTWKLMRIHLDTFTRDSLYDEMNYSNLHSSTIKGSIFRPETGRGYIIRETTDGDMLTEFNSTTRQNLKLQSSPNVDPEYCNFTSAASYTWSDVPNTDFSLVDSTNYTDGAPTSNVTGLLYDNNDYFTAGEMKDTSATTGRISMGANELTEVEYSLQPTSAAKGSFCFRLVDADPVNQNQVSGNPNLIYNIITSDFEVANYHYFVPLTVNGVILEKNEVNVVEGTTTDSYGIKLASLPTADVTVTINADDVRLTLTPDSTPLTPTETVLTFTTENWDTYQYVTASAVDNGIVNGTTTEPLRHTTISTDPGYDNLIVEPVTSIVTDYGATFANVLATVSGTITFTPPGDFSFPSVNTGTTAPNFSPSLTVNVDEGRGTAVDFILTLQADQFCRAQGVCIPLTGVYAATSNLINAFNTFDAGQIGLFLANYLQSGETLDNRDTYVHVDPGQDRPLSAPITLIDSRNVPSGNSENPLQGSIDFDLNLMIDFANLAGISEGTYRTLLTIDLNANPL